MRLRGKSFFNLLCFGVGGEMCGIGSNRCAGLRRGWFGGGRI